jgi:hypothetical protein
MTPPTCCCNSTTVEPPPEVPGPDPSRGGTPEAFEPETFEFETSAWSRNPEELLRVT